MNRFKFKIKLSNLEMNVLGAATKEGVKVVVKAECTSDLLLVESLESFFSKLVKMFRPYKNSYTVQLSTLEVVSIRSIVIPTLTAVDDSRAKALGMRLEQELFNQIKRECNMYNATNYGR